MQVNDLNPNAFADMFATTDGGQQKQAGAPSFGMAEQEQDLFNVGLNTAGLGEGTTVVPVNSSSTEETTQPPTKTAEELAEEAAKNAGNEADILGDGGKKPDDKPEEFKIIADYFQKGMTEGKFVKINAVDEKGNTVPFIPKTLEDFDEVIDVQVNWKLEEAKKGLDKAWYEGKSPAWKAVSQYAEMVDDPTKLIPFLQGVQNIQSVASFDENDIDGAEQIVRVRLEQNGDPEEVINAQIESLKTTDKLLSTAKTLKPIIIQQEQQVLARTVQEEKKIRQQQEEFYNTIKENAFKAIEQPIFGKQKLKNEEKAAIYDLIAEPSAETQGFAIYTEIDKLFDKGDFEKLRKVALLLAKEESFFNYLGTDIANKTATGLQRKLQVAAESHSASGNDFTDSKGPSVTRPFNKQVRFGAADK